MVTIQDVMSAKLVVQMGLVPKDRVQQTLQEMERKGKDGLDLANHLFRAGLLDEDGLRKLRSYVALYGYVRRESLYLRLLEKTKQVPIETVRKVITLVEAESFRRRIGDILRNLGTIDGVIDDRLTRRVTLQVDEQDQQILDRYKRENFSGVDKPLIPSAEVGPGSFKLSTIFRGRNTRAFVRDHLKTHKNLAAHVERDLFGGEVRGEVDFGDSWSLPTEFDVNSDLNSDVNSDLNSDLKSNLKSGDTSEAAVGPAVADEGIDKTVLLAPPVRKENAEESFIPTMKLAAAPIAGLREEAQGTRSIGGYVILDGPRYESIGQAFYRVVGPDGAPCHMQSIDKRAAPTTELARFERQLEVLQQVDHEACLKLVGVGRSNELIFMVLPILEGITLEERIKRQGALPMVEAFDVAERLLDCLAAVHKASAVVRQLSPASLLLLSGRHAFPVLTDFRLASIEKSRVSAEVQAYRTRVDELLGRPAYMAPEALTNDPVDARTDLYSFGVVFFEALTGALPIKATSPERYIEEHLIGQPYTLAEARPDITWAEELERFVAKLLAKRKDDRPVSAAKARESLNEIRDKSVRAAATGPRTVRHDPRALVSGIFNEFFNMDFSS